MFFHNSKVPIGQLVIFSLISICISQASEDDEAYLAAVEYLERQHGLHRLPAPPVMLPAPEFCEEDLRDGEIFDDEENFEVKKRSSKKKKRLKRREEPRQVDPSPVLALEEDDDLFSEEKSEEKKPAKKKRLRKKADTPLEASEPGGSAKKGKGRGLPKFSVNKFLGVPEEEKRLIPAPPKALYAIKEESDDDAPIEGVCDYSLQPLPELSDVIDMGTRLKLMTNVYLGRIDQSANIFFPQYVLEVEQPDGSIKKGKPKFFRTPKGEICVFASGGSHNVWEKTVARVYEIFFEEKVKIIRAWWMQVHLYRDKKISRRLTEEFKDREQELHSEFYYDLFFKHFFLPDVIKKYGDSLKSLTVNAFSWWEVCDSCHEKYLNEHQELCSQNGIKGPYFNIGAVRRYTHHYPKVATMNGYRVPEDQEEVAWRKIWDQLKIYVDMHSDDPVEKKKFWAKTFEGLELCKWIGQAFVENVYSLQGRKVIPKRGDILRFYNEMMEQEEEEAENLKELILYLRDTNYELSCWSRIPYMNRIQGNWKKHWQQIVVPHFNWKILAEFEVEHGDDMCEMCGNEEVRYMSMVYHSKHRVAKNIAETAQDDWREWPFDINIPFDKLTEQEKKERRQSIAVGSDCVQFLQIGRAEVEEWREAHPQQELENRLEALDQRQQQNDDVDHAEAKELLDWMRGEEQEGTSPLNKRYILKHSDYGDAKDLNPLIAILLQRKQIEEVKKGSYVVKKK